MSGPLVEYEDENGKVHVLGEILPFEPSAPRGTFDYTLHGVKVKFGWVYDDVARVRALSKADAEALLRALPKRSP